MRKKTASGRLINLQAADGVLTDNKTHVLAAAAVRHTWHEAGRAVKFARQAHSSARKSARDCDFVARDGHVSGRTGHLRASAVNDVRFVAQKLNSTTAEEHQTAWREGYEKSQQKIFKPKRWVPGPIFDRPDIDPMAPLPLLLMVDEHSEPLHTLMQTWQLPTMAKTKPRLNTVANFQLPRSNRAMTPPLTVMRAAPSERRQVNRNSWELPLPVKIRLRMDTVAKSDPLPHDQAKPPELLKALAAPSETRQGAKQAWELPLVHKAILSIAMLLISQADCSCAQIFKAATTLASEKIKPKEAYYMRRCEFVRTGSAVLYFCSTTRQIGDLVTKNLLFPRFRDCVVQITTTTPLALLAPRWTDGTRTRSNPAFSRSPRGTFEPYHRQSNPQGYRPFSYHIRKDRHRSFNEPRQQGGFVTRRRESEAEANDNWRAANGLQHNGRSRI